MCYFFNLLVCVECFLWWCVKTRLMTHQFEAYFCQCIFSELQTSLTQSGALCAWQWLCCLTHISHLHYSMYVWTFLDGSLKCVLLAGVPEYLTGVSDSDWCQASSLLSQTYVAHIDVLQVYGLAPCSYLSELYTACCCTPGENNCFLSRRLPVLWEDPTTKTGNMSN